MRNQISFYRKGTIVDSVGAVSNTTTVVRENVWAAFKYIGTPSAGASEEEIHSQRTGKIKAEILCRFFAGLKFEDYIYFDGAKFRIYSIQYEGNGKLLKIRAEMRDDDTQFGLPSDNSLENWEGRVAWPKNSVWQFGNKIVDTLPEIHVIPITAPFSPNYEIRPRNSGFGDANLEGRYGSKNMEAQGKGEEANFKITYNGITVMANNDTYYDVYPPTNYAVKLQANISIAKTELKVNPTSLLSYTLAGARTDLPYGYFWAEMEHEWVAVQESATETKLITHAALMSNFARQLPVWADDSFRHASNGRLEYKISEHAQSIEFWRMPDSPNNIVMVDGRVIDTEDLPMTNGQTVLGISATYYPDGWVDGDLTEEDWTAKFTSNYLIANAVAGWTWTDVAPTAEEMASYIGGTIDFGIVIAGVPALEVAPDNIIQTLTYNIV